jgi:hypothetical protein
MRFTIPEILQAVSNERSHAKKVSILQNCGTEVLEQVLQYNFHPDIKFNLPEGEVPYKKETDIPVGKSHSNLYREGRRLYIFIEGQAPNLKPYRREMLFIELLEGLHYTEAEVLIAVKDKTLQDLYPGVTYEAARDAFDRLLPQDPPKKVAKAEKPVKLAIPEVDFDMPVVVAEETVKEDTRPLEQPKPKTRKGEKRGPMSEEQKQKLRESYQRRMAEKAAAQSE